MTIKLRSLLEENNILIPRNLENREEKHKRIDYQRIQEYIKNGSKGYLDLDNTPLTKLPDNLTRVGGDLYLDSTLLTKLPDNLAKVEGSLYMQNSSIEDLNNLEYVGYDLMALNSKLKSLPPKLTRIEGDLNLNFCFIDNIDNLEYIGNNLWINGTDINELPKGLRVGGNLFCRNTPLSKRFPDKLSFKEYLKERNIIIQRNIFLHHQPRI